MHEIMTIEEVAAYLRISERTVYDWAQKGDLPGGKLGTAWRFKRSEIERWVDRHLGTSTPAAAPKVDSSSLRGMLSVDRVMFLDSAQKTGALKQLIDRISTSALVRNYSELEAAIFQREKLMSTGIGFGVAVPHVRIGSVDNLVMALGIARAPITDYVSLDEIPVQIVCMVAAGSTQHPQYIRALSLISSRLKDESVRASLIGAASEAAAYQIFTGENG